MEQEKKKINVKIIIPIIIVVVIGIIKTLALTLKNDNTNKNDNIDIAQVIGQWGYLNINNNNGYLKYFTFEENGKISMLVYPINSGKLNYKGISFYSGTYETIDAKIISNLSAPPFDEKEIIFATEYDSNNNFKLYEEILTTEDERIRQPIHKDNWEDIYKLIKENNWSINVVQERFRDRIYSYSFLKY